MLLVANTLQIIFLLGAPPLMLGIIEKVKAYLTGRTGPSILQVYYNLYKLAHKNILLSQTTTPLFYVTPIINLLMLLLAGLLLPFCNFAAPLHFTGDIFFFIGLLVCLRFFTVLAALDTGSPFSGMGAAREITLGALSEPIILLTLLVLAKISNAATLSQLLQEAPTLKIAQGYVIAPLLLVTLSFFIVLLSDNCRIPIDDPHTHLELTMIHEAMILDYSGPLLGLCLYTAALKLFIFSAFIANLSHLIYPLPSYGLFGDFSIFTGKLCLLSLLMGIIEGTMPRLRLKYVPYLLLIGILLSTLALILLLR